MYGLLRNHFFLFLLTTVKGSINFTCTCRPNPRRLGKHGQYWRTRAGRPSFPCPVSAEFSRQGSKPRHPSTHQLSFAPPFKLRRRLSPWQRRGESKRGPPRRQSPAIDARSPQIHCHPHPRVWRCCQTMAGRAAGRRRWPQMMSVSIFSIRAPPLHVHASGECRTLPPGSPRAW